MFHETDFINRQRELYEQIISTNLSAVALNPGPSLFYFTGLQFHLMERPTIAIFTHEPPPALFLPELEAEKTKNLPYPVECFFYGEDPDKWSNLFYSVLISLRKDWLAIGIEPTRMRYLEMELMMESLPNIKFKSAEELIASIRIRKDDDEINAMRKAVEIAENALLHTLPFIRPDISEKALAAELLIQLFRNGSDPEIPFPPIVSFGENSANPHASPTERTLSIGDLILIDWGANFKGYYSDLTRTFVIGRNPVFDKISKIVEEANITARERIKPGITTGKVDEAARNVIEQNNLGEFFFHRTGHGLGLEAHEQPYIRNGNRQIIEPGMCFTIEPGIYLSGKGGIRIEDNIVVTKEGCETLSTLPRTLKEIDF